MNKADGKKLGARATARATDERRAVVRDVERTQARLFDATCDLLEHLFAHQPQSIDSWHVIGKLTEHQIEGIEHYLATRERYTEDPPWIERLKETVERYRRERVRLDSEGMQRLRQAPPVGVFDLE